MKFKNNILIVFFLSLIVISSYAQNNNSHFSCVFKLDSNIKYNYEINGQDTLNIIYWRTSNDSLFIKIDTIGKVGFCINELVFVTYLSDSSYIYVKTYEDIEKQEFVDTIMKTLLYGSAGSYAVIQTNVNNKDLHFIEFSIDSDLFDYGIQKRMEILFRENKGVLDIKRISRVTDNLDYYFPFELYPIEHRGVEYYKKR